MSRGRKFLSQNRIGNWPSYESRERDMDSIIYLVGLVVVVMFILSLLGLH
jgi:hypothetical protein